MVTVPLTGSTKVQPAFAGGNRGWVSFVGIFMAAEHAGEQASSRRTFWLWWPWPSACCHLASRRSLLTIHQDAQSRGCRLVRCVPPDDARPPPHAEAIVGACSPADAVTPNDGRPIHENVGAPDHGGVPNSVRSPDNTDRKSVV